MIDSTGWAIIGIMLLFVATIISLPFIRQWQWKKFAASHGGKAGSVFKKPSAKFVHNGRQIVVESVGRDEMAGINVTMDWPDPHLRIECFAKEWLSRFSHREAKELVQVETGDAEFDGALLLFGNTSAEAMNFFREPTRRGLLKLCGIWQTRPTLSISGGRLSVHLRHSIWTCRGLETMLAPLLDFYDAAMADHAVSSEDDAH